MFVNASAEGPRGETVVTRAAAAWRSWVRGIFTDLSRELGIADPESLGRKLALLYDGAMVGASIDADPSAASRARALAEVLLDAEAASKRKPAAGKRRRRIDREGRVTASRPR